MVERQRRRLKDSEAQMGRFSASLAVGLVQMATGDERGLRLTKTSVADELRVANISSDLKAGIASYLAGPVSFFKIDLPRSARAFTLYHAGLDRTRVIPSFVELLRRRLISEVKKDVNKMFSLSSRKEPDKILWQMQQSVFSTRNSFRDCLSLYRSVSSDDVRVYRLAVKKIDRLPGIGSETVLLIPMGKNEFGGLPLLAAPVVVENDARVKKELYYGRDAEGAYFARKAQTFGRRDGLVILCFPLSGEIRSNSHLADFVKQEIDDGFYHIDSGYSGRTPLAVMRVLEGDRFDEVVALSRIKLLNSSNSRVEGLTELHAIVSTIEGRPKRIDPADKIVHLNGAYRIVEVPTDSEQQLKAWVVQQAIVRTFLPKAPKKYARATN